MERPAKDCRPGVAISPVTAWRRVHRLGPLRLDGGEDDHRRAPDRAQARHSGGDREIGLGQNHVQLDRMVRKNGHSAFIRRSSSSAPRGRVATKSSNAEPKPNHPGSVTRLCPTRSPREWHADPRCAHWLCARRARTDIELGNLRDRCRGKEVVGEAVGLVDELADRRPCCWRTGCSGVQELGTGACRVSAAWLPASRP